MKVLVVWSGAVVPAYRQFFRELARYMRVRVLAPRRWTHGSVDFTAGTAGGGDRSGAEGDRDCRIVATAYLPPGSSRYLVPALPWHLWSFRPRWLYIMDEMDRPSLSWNALLAKLAWPPVRIVSYSLQNLAAPGYYRWHHRLALRINRTLVSRAIAASGEAAEVLKSHGYPGPRRVIPLWGSEGFFVPADRSEIAARRQALGVPEDALVLLYAGSLAEAKGLLLLRDVLPRFPRIRLVAAGHGPLEGAMREGLGAQWIHQGGLEGEALLRFYQSGDYIILPSLTGGDWKEQIGRSLIEGILCGCVALGSDSGHIPELTLFPETTFRQGDTSSLERMLAGLPLPGAVAIRGAQRLNVAERFTAAAVARQTHDFLAETGAAP